MANKRKPVLQTSFKYIRSTERLPQRLRPRAVSVPDAVAKLIHAALKALEQIWISPGLHVEIFDCVQAILEQPLDCNGKRQVNNSK